MDSKRIRSRVATWGRHVLAGAFGLGVVLVAACSGNGSSSDGGGGSCADAGGPSQGPADTHCNGMPPQAVQLAACHSDAAAGAGDDGGAAMGDDGGAMPACGELGNGGFGATMYGTQAVDDDCKYDITWSSTPICENQPVMFTVVLTNKADHSHATGANVQPDPALDCVHPAPFTWNTTSPEDPPGTYHVGPVTFDKPGKWTIRFHMFEDCDDTPDSPHGHAAFYVDVP